MQANLNPGDTVIVRPGTYNEDVTVRRSGTEGNHITLKSEVPGEAVIKAAGYNAINVGANYVTIDGFDVSSQIGGNGIFGNGVHHVEILNNIAHDSGESGIGFIWSDFVTIEGNETYGNAWKGWYSGISVWEFRNITGDTTTTGPRVIIRNNISHDNVTQDGLHSDGNGIIIDDFHHGQNPGWPPYAFETLVEGNLVYGNGGKGIAVHYSDNVTVSNNTAYHNNVDLQNEATYRGELSNQLGANNVWANNIAVADPSINAANTAIGFYGGGNNGTTWVNNLTYNGTPGQSSLNLDGGNPAPTAANGNKLGVNPHFAGAAGGDFTLQPTSPAIDGGSGDHVFGPNDINGGPRVVGVVDIGAFEAGSNGGSLNSPPVTNADTGFATAVDTAIVIPASALLANDSDPDDDPLVLTGVTAPDQGTVSINANGNVVFTPAAGYSGPAGFTYTVSDGNGGLSSSPVSVSVNAAPPVNAAPTFTSGANLSIDEDTTRVGVLKAVDPDGDTLTFAKLSGGDAALFTVNPTTGLLSFTTAPDYDNPADGNGDNVYDVRVSVTDGNTTPTTETFSVTVKDVDDAPTTESTTFFSDSATPTRVETGDPVDYELGMRFTPTTSGEIVSLRYYRGEADATDTDTRVLHLWSEDGTELAQATVKSAPGAVGWQTVDLETPVSVDANALYVVSYGTTQNYAETQYYFGEGMENADGSLEVSAGAQGVYSDKGPGQFPTQTWHASNYWADVVFKPSAAASPDVTTGSGAGIAGPDGLADSAPFGLVVSSSSDRSAPQALQGAILTDDAFITTTGTEDVKSVEFWLDDPAIDGEPTSIERFHWHDFAGTAKGGDALPWDTSDVPDGDHTITAEITFDDGSNALISAAFIIDNF